MPDYRFWGKTNPQGRQKPAILAMAPEAAVDENGVATIRLYDPVDSYGDWWGVSAREFLSTLDSIPSATQINLHVNSPGGEVYDAIAILNGLRAHPARVTAIVDGIAASAASFIACGCDELVMAQNSELMIHDAWGIGIGPASTMRDLADQLDRISNNIASIYAAKASGSVEAWRTAMLAETWYSADEAVTAGLADSVQDAPATAAAAKFDLGAFKNAGRAAAPDPVIVPAAKATEPTEHQRRHAARRHQLAAERNGIAVPA